MVASDIPQLQFTPIEDIQERASRLRKSFLEHKTRDVEFRLKQLRKLYWAIKDHEEQIVEALAQDLGRPRFESEVSETLWMENDIVFVSRNLHKWVKDEKAEDIDLNYKFMNPKIRKDPLGCVLVIGYKLAIYDLPKYTLTFGDSSIVHSTSPFS
jgi:beta-apo-4'-carotenal oxygenase